MSWTRRWITRRDDTSGPDRDRRWVTASGTTQRNVSTALVIATTSFAGVPMC